MWYSRMPSYLVAFDCRDPRFGSRHLLRLYQKIGQSTGLERLKRERPFYKNIFALNECSSGSLLLLLEPWPPATVFMSFKANCTPTDLTTPSFCRLVSLVPVLLKIPEVCRSSLISILIRIACWMESMPSAIPIALYTQLLHLSSHILKCCTYSGVLSFSQFSDKWNTQKCRWCVLESNPWPRNGKHRQIHWALGTFPLLPCPHTEHYEFLLM